MFDFHLFLTHNRGMFSELFRHHPSQNIKNIPLGHIHVLVSSEGQRSFTARSEASGAGRALVSFSNFQQGKTCFINYCAFFFDNLTETHVKTVKYSFMVQIGQ